MYYLCIPKTINPVFISSGKFFSHNRNIHPKRKLDSAVLLIGYSGEYPISQDGRNYCLSKGTAMLLFPHREHGGTDFSTDQQSHFWCHFYLPETYEIVDEKDLLTYSKDGTYCILPEYFQLPDFEKYCILFPQLIDAAETEYTNADFRTAICSSYLKILLTTLAEHHACFIQSQTSQTSKNILVSKTTEWIKLHASDDIATADVAEAMQYNNDYLSHLLKKETGMSICEYINFMRIQQAKRLLLNSNMYIYEIAYAVGFRDAKYFMKIFKTVTGITAKEFRQSHYKEHHNKK